VDDPRPQELLESAARVAGRLGLALSWTDGLSGTAAKACSGEGSASWQRARPLSGNEDAAVGYFVNRARKRGPVVPAVVNGFVIVEADLNVPDDAYRDAEIRRVLDPLAHLSARRRFSSLAVVHLNRRSDTDVLNRITGSGGYGGSARSILTFGRHPEDDAQHVVAAEGNWQREAHSDLFELREVVVFPDAGPEDQTQPTLVHIGISELDSSDLVSASSAA
jgi:hypothetical protein